MEKYFSNDWLIPMGEQTKQVLAKYSMDQALAIASVVAVQEGIGQPNVPWTIVFESDDLDESLNRLERTLAIPLGISPGNDEEIRDGINELERILDEAGADTGMLAAHASSYMLKVAHGDPNEGYYVYQDLARFYPQYAGEWRKSLSDQFGVDFEMRLIKDHSRLFAVLDLDIINASTFDLGPLQGARENTPEYLRRTFATVGIVGFDEMIRILNRRLTPYMKAAHNIRGLQLPSDNDKF